MRYYSTFSARMTLVRKDGYYMSDITADRVAKKLAPVLGLNASQVQKVSTILTRGFVEDERMTGFTPAELDVIRKLGAWYSYEYTEFKDNPVFVVCNLNAGRTLVISERK